MGGKSYTPEIVRLLKKAGCVLVKSGKHQKWKNPKTGQQFSVPHKCRVKHTANSIMQSAGIDKKF